MKPAIPEGNSSAQPLWPKYQCFLRSEGVECLFEQAFSEGSDPGDDVTVVGLNVPG